MLIDFKVKTIGSHILHLHFPHKKQMAHTLCRIQEFYENPDLKDKIFTKEKLILWSQKFYNSPKFNYFTAWDGFNFPTEVLSKFLLLYGHKKLTHEELCVAAEVAARPEVTYILVDSEDSAPTTLRHELAHALYFSSSSYRSEVQKELKAIPIPTKTSMKKKLLDMGYCSEVIPDEMQAYLAEKKDPKHSSFHAILSSHLKNLAK